MKETVTLTRAQIDSIHINMSLESIDTTNFWRLARKENADPGCVARRREEYFAKHERWFDRYIAKQRPPHKGSDG
jgi:hypothetical protein